MDSYWTLHWDVEQFGSSLVPHFSSNLTLEHGGARGLGPGPVVTGVPSRRFDVDLSGSGWVVGVKFHPGALAGCSAVAARELTDRTVPASDVLPRGVAEDFAAAARAGTEDLDAALAPLVDRADDVWAGVKDLVDLGERDASMTTVAALADAGAMTVRGLQRRFARYVGLSPKQVLVRARLHDAVAALDENPEAPLADLAHDLGFFDQAHLTREFTAFVGVPPSAYRSGQPVR